MQLVAEDGELRTPDGDVVEREYPGNGVLLIAASRLEQLKEQGNRSELPPGELAQAAIAMGACAVGWDHVAYTLWPWGKWDRKHSDDMTKQDKIDMLVKAGAFIAAEIDRMEGK